MVIMRTIYDYQERLTFAIFLRGFSKVDTISREQRSCYSKTCGMSNAGGPGSSIPLSWRQGLPSMVDPKQDHGSGINTYLYMSHRERGVNLIKNITPQ